MKERIQTAMPLMCPSCGNLMKKKLDKKMWIYHQMCLDCVIKMESELRGSGKYEEYEQKKIEENMIAYLEDKEQQAKEYIDGLGKISFLQNSHGDIENWDISPEQIEAVKKKYIGHLKDVQENLNKIRNKKEEK